MTPKIKYFLYIRKSTDDDKHQVLSLPAQVSELHNLAKRDSLHIYEVVEESMTAKKPGRPLFNAMLDRIERGEAQGIIVWDVDRLYRNPIDEGRTRWLLQRGVIVSIRTPSREYAPRDAGLLMAVESGRAVEHILSMARNLQRTYDEKLRRGQWPGQKTAGYVFDDRIKNIVPHPNRAKAVRELFEEFAKGRLGLASGADFIFERGITTKNGTPLSKSEMRRLLTNRLYMGVMVWKGEAYEGKFTPIVTAELFQAVQKVIKVKSKPRKVRHGHNFPFCGTFRCSCGAMITAQWAKGHGGLYRYCRCSRKALVKCYEPYVREEHLAAQCLDMLRPFALLPEEAAEVRAVLEAEAAKERDTQSAAFEKAMNDLRPIEEKLRKLTRCLLDDVIDEDSYRAAKEELVLEKTLLKQERQRLNKTGENMWVEPARKLVNTLETLGKAETATNFPEISGIVQLIGTNRLISRKTVSFSFSEDYDFVPSLLASVRSAPASVPSPMGSLNLQSSKWCLLVTHIRTHFSKKSVLNTPET